MRASWPCLVLLAVSACRDPGGPPWAPGDHVIRDELDDHRADFETIVRTLTATPGLRSVSPNGVAGPTRECHTPGRGAGPPFVCGGRRVGTWAAVASHVGVAPSTLDAVRTALSDTGYCSVSRDDRGGFVFWRSCSHHASWSKDLVYALRPPRPTVGDATRDRPTELEVFAPLGGRWYVRRAGPVP